MIFIQILIKSIAISLFALASAYTLKCSKSNTGIKLDYLYTAIFIAIVLWWL